MNQKKKILFIILGLILALVILVVGIRLGVGKTLKTHSYRIECPCNVKVLLPLQTDMITGWQVFLYGKIIDISPEKLTLLSKSGTEVASVKLVREGIWKTIYQDFSKISEKDQGSFIKFEDLKVGDYVSIRAGVSRNGDEYIAMWVLWKSSTQ